jgi:hypothetical protein
MPLEILNFVLEKKSQNNPLRSQTAGFFDIHQIAEKNYQP